MHYLIKSIRTHLCSNKLKPRCHYDRTYRHKRKQKTVCCSLLSSTSNMDRSGELSDFERRLVTGCHISKKSVRNIPSLLKFPKSTVGDVTVKWKCEGTTIMKPRPRPCRSSAVRRWLPTEAARVRVRAACGLCGGQSDSGAGFLRVLRFPLPIIPPITPLS
jgi:hypothetical protein